MRYLVCFRFTVTNSFRKLILVKIYNYILLLTKFIAGFRNSESCAY